MIEEGGTLCSSSDPKTSARFSTGGLHFLSDVKASYRCTMMCTYTYRYVHQNPVTYQCLPIYLSIYLAISLSLTRKPPTVCKQASLGSTFASEASQVLSQTPDTTPPTCDCGSRQYFGVFTPGCLRDQFPCTAFCRYLQHSYGTSVATGHQPKEQRWLLLRPSCKKLRTYTVSATCA